MIPTTPEQQQKLANLVKERAIHLTAIEGFKERKKEIGSELTEEFGKGHGIDLDTLALIYLKDDKKQRAAQETLDKFEEGGAEVEVLSKYINRDSVYDTADKYLEVK